MFRSPPQPMWDLTCTFFISFIHNLYICSILGHLMWVWLAKFSYCMYTGQANEHMILGVPRGGVGHFIGMCNIFSSTIYFFLYISPLWMCTVRSHALGVHSRPAALLKPIIILILRPRCWKGLASKPYVEHPKFRRKIRKKTPNS